MHDVSHKGTGIRDGIEIAVGKTNVPHEESKQELNKRRNEGHGPIDPT